MFTPKGGKISEFTKKLNQKGHAYYSTIFESCELYLFSQDQYWCGMTEESDTGSFMIKEFGTDNLEKVGSWRKQKNGTLAITGQVSSYRYGFVGVFNDECIELYEAEPGNSIEGLLIT